MYNYTNQIESRAITTQYRLAVHPIHLGHWPSTLDDVHPDTQNVHIKTHSAKL